MFSKARRVALWLGATVPLTVAIAHSTAAHAQRWDDRGPSWHQRGSWERQREEVSRREWERRRHDDAKAAGVVAGVVGTAVLVGVIAAAANRDKEERARARVDYCVNRYGNYDQTTDSYRASNGYAYRCE